MANNYCVPALEKESANGIQQVSLVTEAFANRRIFLFGEIDEMLVYSFTMQMLNLMEDEQSEINIYSNSPGGEVDSGLAIYDLIHEPLIPNGVGGSASSIKSTADSILQTRELLNGILACHSEKTLEEINKATDHDDFMTAQETIDFGLCDEVVTRII